VAPLAHVSPPCSWTGRIPIN